MNKLKKAYLVLFLIGLSTSVYAQTATNKIDTTGNVGIGKLNPVAALEVQGSGGNQIRLNQTGTLSRYLNIWHGSSSGVIDAIGGGDLYLGYSTTTNILLNRNGGNVGIGTTSPAYKLDVNGTLGVSNTAVFNSSPTARIKLNSANTYGALEVFMSNSDTMYGANYSYLNMHRGGSVAWQMGLINNDFVIARGGGAGQKTLFSDRPFMISNSGNVGIGTSSPLSKLDIAGSNGDVIRVSGNTTIQGGTSGILFVQRNAPNDYGGAVRLVNTGGTPQYLNPRLDFAVQDVSTNVLSSVTTKMSVLGNGNVGIGTTNPDSKLTVKGDIHAEEVKVDLSVPGPDYVFEEEYDLTSLKALEAYIKANKHLPEIPSAKEMEEKGIDLGVMNMLLLKKIEELTLHTISQEKALQSEKQKNESVNKTQQDLIEQLMKRLEKLEKGK